MGTSISRRSFVTTAAAVVGTAALASSVANASETALIPGTYTVTVPSIKGDMTVAVSFSDSAITDVHVLECADSNVIKDAAIASVAPRIVDQQNIEVDATAGATFTSMAIESAVAQAIEQAGGDPAAFQKGSDAVTDKAQGEAEEFDVVVIGAGAAGLCVDLL